MKTRNHLLHLGFAALFVGSLTFTTPAARAGDDEAAIVAGALLGGVLGYLIHETNEDRPRHVCRPGCGHRHETVIVRPPVRACPPPPARRVVIIPSRPRYSYRYRHDYGNRHGLGRTWDHRGTSRHSRPDRRDHGRYGRDGRGHDRYEGDRDRREHGRDPNEGNRDNRERGDRDSHRRR